MASTSITKEELRERIEILDVIGQVVRLQRAGTEYRGLCPFHDEKTPSFYVNAEKGLWVCRGACGEGGDVFDFVMKHERCEFREACEILARRIGCTIAFSPTQQRRSDQRERLLAACQLAARLFRGALWRSAGGAIAREYLAERGVDEEAARRFGLGYAPAGWDNLVRHLEQKGVPPADLEAAGLIKRRERGEGYYDRFRNRLMFPIFDHRGRTVAFGGRILDPDDEPKYLNSNETAIFSKRQVLYGLNFAVGNLDPHGAVVVEGYMDVIALHQNGLPYAVATLGTSLTADHLRLLRRHTDRVALCYDADTAGARATDRAAAAFIEESIDGRVLALPAGLDPDEFVRREGREAFEARLADAPDVIDYRLGLVLEQVGDDPAQRSAAVQETVVAILGDIRDELRQAQYVRRIAEWWSGEAIGLQEEFERTLTRALRRRRARPARPGSGRGTAQPVSGPLPPRRRPRREQVERRVVGALLRRPALLESDGADELAEKFAEPVCKTVYEALAAIGPSASAEALSDALDQAGRSLMAELLCAEEDEEAVFERLLAELRWCDLETRAEALRREREALPEGDLEAEEELFRRLGALERELDEMEQRMVRWHEDRRERRT